MKADDVIARMKPSIEAFADHSRDIAEDALGQYWSMAEQFCESEIEKVFFMAWMLRLEVPQIFGAGCGGRATSKVFRGADPPFDAADVLEYEQVDLLWTQAPVERYRADFVARRIERNSGTTARVVSPKVIVECDGHDFHEKTKQQAAHDKERDRELQSRGFYVLRFTGWEIWNRPDKCASQLDEFFEDHIASAVISERALRTD